MANNIQLKGGTPRYVGARAFVTKENNVVTITLTDYKGETVETISEVVEDIISNPDGSLTFVTTGGQSFTTDSLTGPKGDTGEKGAKGDTGDAAGFGTVTATADSNVGTPSVSVTTDGPSTALDIAFAFSNIKGNPGVDGYSPTASVSKSGGTSTISITDKNGTTTATVNDGADGQDGTSPEVSIESITGGHTVTITDVDHPSGQSFDVLDGEVTEASLDAKLSKGYYEGFHAGQLISKSSNADSRPYTIRRSPQFPDGYDAEQIDKLIGGTVAWNQLWDVHEEVLSVTPSIPELGNYYANYVIPVFQQIKDHKYLIHLTAKDATSNYVSFNYCMGGNYAEIALNGTGDVYKVMSASSNGSGLSRIYGNANTSLTVTVTAQVIDLTALFGSSEIADYVYALETATAGAGIAKLKSWGFDIDSYHAYDSGSLESVNVSAHKTVGFNQWDEEWELGGINADTGANQSNTDGIRSKNYIPCIPTETYYFKLTQESAWVYQYDSDKTYLGRKSVTRGNTFTVDANCRFIRFFIGYNTTTYNHDICINISKTTGSPKNGDYVPYEKHSYPLDSDLELRGIPKLDASNNLYYDGDVYEPSGSVSRKYGIVDLGTLNWYYNTDYNHFYSSDLTSIAKANSDSVNSAGYGSARNGDKTMYVGWSAIIYCFDSSYSEGQAPAFKAAMSGKYLVYELATPTTESADPYKSIQVCDPDGTEEFVDALVEAGTRDIGIPVGHQTRYPYDLRGKLEDLPTIPDAPSTDGDYVLKATVVDGVPAYTWESE